MREARFSDIGELGGYGGEAVMELEVRGRGHERVREKWVRVGL